MNGYSPFARTRIQQHEIANVIRAHPFGAGAHVANLERQRCQFAEAERHALLKRTRVATNAGASPISALRRVIGAALVHAGHRLAPESLHNSSPRTTVQHA